MALGFAGTCAPTLKQQKREKNGFSRGDKSTYSTVSSYIMMQILMLMQEYYFHKVYVLSIESWSVLVMNVTPGQCLSFREAHQSFSHFQSPHTHTYTHNTNFNKRLSFSIYIIYLWAVTSKVQIVFQTLKLQLRDLIHFSSRCSSDKGPLHHIYLRLSMFNAQNNCSWMVLLSSSYVCMHVSTVCINCQKATHRPGCTGNI